MKIKQNLFNKNTIILVSSVIASFLFVAIISYAVTTISTNVNTGGTLTVTGASTLTGAIWASNTLQATGITTLYDNLVVDTNTLFVDSANNRVGIGTTGPDSLLQLSKLYNGETTFLHINNQSDWGQTGDIVFSYNAPAITLGKITTSYKAINSGKIAFYQLPAEFLIAQP